MARKITININIETLSHHIKQSGVPLGRLQESVPDYNEIVTGNKSPTYQQLEKISKLIRVPLGLLVIESPLDVATPRISFRTRNSREIVDMSSELRETIIEMQEKQSFLQSQIDEDTDITDDQVAGSTDHPAIAEYIRNKLDIPVDYLHDTKGNSLSYFRDRASSIGVFIFFNGKIKDNTHRPLDPDEFRGFSLKSSRAPIIFVNQRDSQNAQLFTLVHELTHLFVNNEGVSDKYEQADYDHAGTEALVNRVTAELLVPKQLFMAENTLDIEQLASKYSVSRYVIARRLLDFGRISKARYDSIVRSMQTEKLPYKRSSSGNYINSLRFRTDRVFFGFVYNAIMQDRISYTEAFRLIGTGYKGFKALEGSLR